MFISFNYFDRILKLIWRYIKMKIMIFLSSTIEIFTLEDENEFSEEKRTSLTQSSTIFLPFSKAEETAFTVLDVWFPNRHTVLSSMIIDNSDSSKTGKIQKINTNIFSDRERAKNNYLNNLEEQFEDDHNMTDKQENILDIEDFFGYQMHPFKNISLPTVLLFANEENRKSLELMKSAWKNYDPVCFVEHLIGKDKVQSLMKDNDYLGLYRRVMLFTDDAIIQEGLKEMTDISLSIKLQKIENKLSAITNCI